jgi:exonuclease SbcD
MNSKNSDINAMPTILHFADAHIDMANYGRHDPNSGLPMRVLDFLKSLDTIIDAAIEKKVDLVIFAGDAYKDRTPSPTFQREWGRRIIRLSKSGIPTLLLIGNHDLSPSIGRAHAIQEFDTLEVPNIHVISKPTFLGPKDLDGVQLQVIALPWISRSGIISALGLSTENPSNIYAELEQRITTLVQSWLEQAEPDLPIVLTAHASVQGASFGSERSVMLGGDLVLPASLVKDPRLDYVALGHIHKPQDLNEGNHPPVIYPGSIERVDFGEAKDHKYYILANVQRGKTIPEWQPLSGIRPFIDCSINIDSAEQVTNRLLEALPPEGQVSGAIIRLTVNYPKELEGLIDEAALRQATDAAFEFHLNKRPKINTRIRIPENQSASSLPAIELLDIYWRSIHLESTECETLKKMATEIINEAFQESIEEGKL